MTQRPRTVQEVLKAATDYLAGKKVDQPRLACELLISRLLNCRRLDLYLRFNSVLSDKQLEAMRRGVRRLAGGEPVQYVLGQSEFMGHVFKVDRRALIPRPETEVLVEQVLKCEPLWQIERPAIVDVGTGAGCVVIGLALARPKALYIGLDTSDEAIELARENAALLAPGQKIAFVAAELSDVVDPGSVDAVVANPPYVPTAEYEKLPVHIHDHEPRIALDGGPDGLSIIEIVVQDAGIILKPGGFLFLETGENQADSVTSLLRDSGFEKIAVEKDLAGKDRVVCGVLSLS